MTNPVTPTPISALPPAPLVTDAPAQFDDKAFPFAAALDPLRAGINTAASQTYQNAVAAGERAIIAASEADRATTQANAAASSASAASGYASAASTSASNAAESADAAEASAIEASKLNLGNKSAPPTLDNQGGPLRAGATYYDTTLNRWRVWDGSAWTEGISAVAGVSSLDGQAGPLTLKTINGLSLLGAGNIEAGSSLYRVARTGNTQLVAADNGKLVDITSGTFTQTFAAASVLGDGWFCYLKNGGAGDITLDPNGAELIDGLTSYIMYPGEVRLVQCDGLALRSVVLNAFYKVFTASSTFTKPPGYSVFQGLLWGGGGSGGKTNEASYYGGGGGGGTCVPFTIPEGNVSASESVTIGAGGLRVSAVSVGNFGGDSSFGAFIVSYGGGGGGQIAGGSGSGGGGGGGLRSAGGKGQSDGSGGGAAGRSTPITAATSDFVFGGAPGASGGGITPPSAPYYGGGGGACRFTSAVAGGDSIYGGAGGGAGASGGVSKFGGNGGAGGPSAPGSDGAAPGGGGGGTGTGATSGSGARGELRIWGII